MHFVLKIWRQKNANAAGGFVIYHVRDISPEMSFLEALDVLNEELLHKGEDPIAFAHDCREGICGSCGVCINGQAHGPLQGATTCQLRMRAFHDGDTLVVEPWRARAFPLIKDLVVDRSAFDRLLQAGGYVSVNTGAAPDANAISIAKPVADAAFDAAACIGCGACVASCKNASAMLFVAAKVAHLALLPQGQPEKDQRVKNMVTAMDKELFGACSNTSTCEAACPKGISVSHIAKLNREYSAAVLRS